MFCAIRALILLRGRSRDGETTQTKCQSIGEKAKALDAKIEAAGGLAEFWLERQRDARARGESYYRRLVDPVTDEVIAELETCPTCNDEDARGCGAVCPDCNF